MNDAFPRKHSLFPFFAPPPLPPSLLVFCSVCCFLIFSQKMKGGFSWTWRHGGSCCITGAVFMGIFSKKWLRKMFPLRIFFFNCIGGDAMNGETCLAFSVTEAFWSGLWKPTSAEHFSHVHRALWWSLKIFYFRFLSFIQTYTAVLKTYCAYVCVLFKGEVCKCWCNIFYFIFPHIFISSVCQKSYYFVAQ